MGARNRTQVLCGSNWHSGPISNLSIPGRFSFYVFVCWGGGGRRVRRTCGQQNSACQNCVSPSIMWVQGIQPRSAGLGQGPLPVKLSDTFPLLA